MRAVGAYEAKTHLPRLLQEVALGESITITKHGRPVAMLIPPSATSRPDVNRLIDELIAYRETIDLAPGPSIKEMVGEGRV